MQNQKCSGAAKLCAYKLLVLHLGGVGGREHLGRGVYEVDDHLLVGLPLLHPEPAHASIKSNRDARSNRTQDGKWGKGKRGAGSVHGGCRRPRRCRRGRCPRGPGPWRRPEPALARRRRRRLGNPSLLVGGDLEERRLAGVGGWVELTRGRVFFFFWTAESVIYRQRPSPLQPTCLSAHLHDSASRKVEKKVSGGVVGAGGRTTSTMPRLGL